MKNIIFMVLLCCCPFTIWGYSCPSCASKMLEDDNFCPNCGRSRYERAIEKKYYREQSTSSDSFEDRLAGMGRGVATIVLSPLNLFRGMVVGVCWTASIAEKERIQDGAVIMYLSLLTIPVGTVTSSFVICADAVNGTIDFVSAGYYGDSLYKSKDSGKPTPWLWERKWKSNEIPWLDRK